MTTHDCPIHGDEHWEETELTTATYSYCTRCSDVTTLERYNYCEEHDEDYESTLLASGTYDFCVKCSNEKIEQKMKAARAELTTNGYRLGEAHADPPRTFAQGLAQEQRRTA